MTVRITRRYAHVADDAGDTAHLVANLVEYGAPWSCDICVTSNEDGWARCKYCNHEQGTWRCDECDHLNPPKSEECESCGRPSPDSE